MSRWRSVVLAFVAVPVGLLTGTVVAVLLSRGSDDLEVFGAFYVDSTVFAVFLAGGFILGPWISLRVARYRGAGITAALAVVLFVVGLTILSGVIYSDLEASIPYWATAVLLFSCAPLARIVVTLGVRPSVESPTTIAPGGTPQPQPKATPGEALASIATALLYGFLGAMAGGIAGFGVGFGVIVVSGMGGFGAGFIVMGIAGVGVLIGMVIGTAIGLGRSPANADTEGADRPR